MTRCDWADGHPLLEAYHDQEWGTLTRRRETLFEFMVLEGAQAGLSWLSVLKRRTGYREAFKDFRPEAVAEFGDAEATALLENPHIIRNRAKIRSAISNARLFLAVEEVFDGFDRYLDTMTGGPICHHYQDQSQVPVSDVISQRLSRDLVRRGFAFMGPTICYSYLEAVGWFMDHVTNCYRYAELTDPS